MKSRKFWFTIFWNVLLLLSLVGDIFFDAKLASQILPWAGGMTTAYIGVQGLIDGKNK